MGAPRHSKPQRQADRQAQHRVTIPFAAAVRASRPREPGAPLPTRLSGQKRLPAGFRDGARLHGGVPAPRRRASRTSWATLPGAMYLLVLGANVVCWGAIVVVWIAAAVRDARTPRDVRVRGSTEIGLIVLAMVAVAAILLVGRSILAPFTLEATWARMIGAGVLAGSTLFAIWARLALGGSWSVGPLASTERGVRTDGPYAITRHPIYTGLLGCCWKRDPGRAGAVARAFRRRPRRRRAQDPVRGTTPPGGVVPRTGS